MSFFNHIDWAAALAAFNLAAIGVLMRIQPVMHKKQIKYLSGLKQSEFVKEVQSFREFYEEKKIVLEDKADSAISQSEKRALAAQDQAKKTKEKLLNIVSRLNLKEKENKELLQAMHEAETTTSSELYERMRHGLKVNVMSIISNAKIVRRHLERNQTGEFRNIELMLGDIQSFAEDIQYTVLRDGIPYGAKKPYVAKPLKIITNLAHLSGVVSASTSNTKSRIVLSENLKKIPIINSDPEVLDIVFYELLSNSLRYSEKESDVKVNVESDNDGEVEISICNLAPTLSEDDMNHIFYEGYRTEYTMRRNPMGVGAVEYTEFNREYWW